jgi:ADP-heptose:LPS heptosyltransferase
MASKEWKAISKKYLKMDSLLYFFLIIVDKTIPRKRRQKKSDLVVIKIDGIGDYFLFRDFIKILAESKKFCGKKITLICNEDVADISKVLDEKYVSEVIAIDRVKFKSNLCYRWKKLYELRGLSFEYLINAHHSRGFYCSDWICKFINAKFKAANRGDFANISVDNKRISDKWYTSLIDLREQSIFEFEKNNDFISRILNEKVELKKPEINIKKPQESIIDLLISIGAGSIERIYSVDKVINILKIILTESPIKVGIIASQLSLIDQSKIKNFCKKYGVDDFVGNLNLSGVLGVIARSRVVISSDTSIQHIAVALGVPEIIVLSNGNYYGRFCPYPKGMHENYSLVLHPKFDKNEKNIFDKASALQIKEIDENLVLIELRKALNRNKLI